MEPLGLDELLSKYRTPIFILLSGAILILAGVFFVKSGITSSETKVQVLSATTASQDNKQITAEIAGEVVNPGVYKLPVDNRVEDLLIMSGGLSVDADRGYVEKNVNRAAKLIDGQKIYIPSTNEQLKQQSAKNVSGDQSVSSGISSDSSTFVNINTASLTQLDTLPGIGPTYGQKIIEQRPYSNTTELLSKGVLTKSIYEKIKSKISVY